MIYECGIITASNTDLLSAGRLNAIPFNGRLTLDFAADLNNATNFWEVTIQEPEGDVPVDAQRIPGTNPSLGGVLDERQLFRMSMIAKRGGHFTVNCQETGTAILTYRAVLR